MLTTANFRRIQEMKLNKSALLAHRFLHSRNFSLNLQRYNCTITWTTNKPKSLMKVQQAVELMEAFPRQQKRANNSQLNTDKQKPASADATPPENHINPRATCASARSITQNGQETAGPIHHGWFLSRRRRTGPKWFRSREAFVSFVRSFLRVIESRKCNGRVARRTNRWKWGSREWKTSFYSGVELDGSWKSASVEEERACVQLEECKSLEYVSF